MDNINFSFVIPHKNSPQYLNDLLRTIPFRNDIEIIIVDDNSSSDIIRWENFEFETNNVVRLIQTKDGKGAGFARNIGLRNASGKWILFPDCDDLYTDKLVDVLDFCINTDYEVIYFKYRFVTLHKDQVEPSYNSWVNDSRAYKDSVNKIKYLMNAPWNKIVKKSFIDNNNIKFEEVLNGNDIFFTYQVGFFSKNIWIDDRCVYYYIEHEKSITNGKKHTNEYYLCNFRHRLQSREFLKMIGHPSWSKGLLTLFATFLMKKGWGALFQSVRVFFANYREIVNGKYFFVNYFKSKK